MKLDKATRRALSGVRSVLDPELIGGKVRPWHISQEKQDSDGVPEEMFQDTLRGSNSPDAKQDDFERCCLEFLDLIEEIQVPQRALARMQDKFEKGLEFIQEFNRRKAEWDKTFAELASVASQEEYSPARTEARIRMKRLGEVARESWATYKRWLAAKWRPFKEQRQAAFNLLGVISQEMFDKGMDSRSWASYYKLLEWAPETYSVSGWCPEELNAPQYEEAVMMYRHSHLAEEAKLQEDWDDKGWVDQPGSKAALSGLISDTEWESLLASFSE